ncbi:MAG: DJ-1/PfpI family protein [bacterium]
MRKVLILVENGYEEMELWVPYYRFLEAEVDVVLVLVGPEAGCTYTGKHGLAARADVSFVDAKLDDARAVLSAVA